MLYLEHCAIQAERAQNAHSAFKRYVDAYPGAVDTWAAIWAESAPQSIAHVVSPYDGTPIASALRIVGEMASIEAAIERMRELPDSLDGIRRVLLLFMLDWPGEVMACPEDALREAVALLRS